MNGWLTRWLPWILFALVVVVSFVAWADMRGWKFSNLTALAVFPLLGLLAWSVMWTHYALGGMRLVQPHSKNRLYSRVSAVVVLACLLLHPGLLAWNQWDVTGVLPPTSFYNYVGTSMKGAVLLGSISLLIFLAFDVFEYLHKKTWIQRNWKWISLSQMVAMTFIFAHSLLLGSTLQNSWFQMWWVLLGVLLIPCFGLILRADWAKKPTNDAKDV